MKMAVTLPDLEGTRCEILRRFRIFRSQVLNILNFLNISHLIPSKSGNLSTWEHQIWNLLKNMHLEIPISFILDNILYSPKTLTLYPEPYMVTLLKSTWTPDIFKESTKCPADFWEYT
jgi:hypothetical protein